MLYAERAASAFHQLPSSRKGTRLPVRARARPGFKQLMLLCNKLEIQEPLVRSPDRKITHSQRYLQRRNAEEQGWVGTARRSGLKQGPLESLVPTSCTSKQFNLILHTLLLPGSVSLTPAIKEISASDLEAPQIPWALQQEKKQTSLQSNGWE